MYSYHKANILTFHVGKVEDPNFVSDPIKELTFWGHKVDNYTKHDI